VLRVADASSHEDPTKRTKNRKKKVMGAGFTGAKKTHIVLDNLTIYDHNHRSRNKDGYYCDR
jgi:hypothetical protein